MLEVRTALPLCLALCCLGGNAWTQEEVASCDDLLKEARGALKIATDAFNRLGDEGSDSHETRLEAETACQTAMGNSDLALEYHVDECGQEAEGLLVRASSLYFWIRRTAPMTFYDWKNSKAGGGGDDDIFSSADYEEVTRKNREGPAKVDEEPDSNAAEDGAETEPEVSAAERACEGFEAAKKVESKDAFEAVMAYSAVASEFPNEDCGKQAMARVAAIMNPESKAKKPLLSAVVSSLKKGLGSSVPGDRIMAARDARNLKAKSVVMPLIKALMKEKPDSPVPSYLLAALRTTHKRETCLQLGDPKKGGPKRFKDKDEGKQLQIIDCLADIGGSLGGKAIGSFLSSKNEKVIDHAFTKLSSLGIDGGVGLAVGLGPLLKSKKQPRVNKCLDLMAAAKHGACTAAILMRGKGLLSKKQKGNPYFDKIVGREGIYQDAYFWTGGVLAKIGWNGVWVLIEDGLGGGEPRTRTYSHFILKKITGWSIALNDQAWKNRFREAVRSGARPLPYGMRRIP